MEIVYIKQNIGEVKEDKLFKELVKLQSTNMKKKKRKFFCTNGT